LGTLSDGDIRRALLSGAALSDSIESCMCKAPTTVKVKDSRETILAMMHECSVHQLPLIDESGVVIGLKLIDDFLKPESRGNWVVIMAGGLGTRLKDMTRNRPKPMLPIGEKPLLEIIIKRFTDQGYSNIWLAVNHFANQIEEYFGNGENFGAKIQYLREDMRLGTAGALSLLPTPDLPILVCNADLLTKVDYGGLLNNHASSNALATMAVRQHEYSISLGVVKAQENRILQIEEKPSYSVTVNAGIYVLSPSVLPVIPKQTFFDMPELFVKLIESGREVFCQHIDDYWIDIGHKDDLQQAMLDYPKFFNDK
jgi:NDP-sugar pyrophosphorylase family protein